MFFQLVLKGISSLDDAEALERLRTTGIPCRWWARVHRISPAEIKDKLSDRNLDWHLNRYDQPDPTQNNDPFYEHTPFISTTAGVVERDALMRRNWLYPPLLTALQFATRDFTQVGYVFYAYVYTLGKKGIELRAFSEEVRDLLMYTGWLPYHPEGEVVAKIEIPSVNLEKYEKYDGRTAWADLASGRLPRPIDTQLNPSYEPPERFANVRGLIT